MFNVKETIQKKLHYTDEEINEIAQWFQDLTIDQVFFLKRSYDAFLDFHAHEVGNGQIH